MEEAMAFMRSQPVRQYAKGQFLLYQGEEPDVLFVVRSGFIKVYDISSQGAEQIVWFAKKYDVIPLDWLFSLQTHSPFFYSAFTDVEVFAVKKDDFLGFVKDRNDILREINRQISDKYQLTLKRLSAVQKPRAREKILHNLIFLIERFSVEHDHTESLRRVTLPLTHQNVASLTGLTREKTSLELLALKKDGIIDYTPTTFVINTDKLDAVLET